MSISNHTYQAIISQQGTLDPVEVALQGNSFPSAFVFTRMDVGKYQTPLPAGATLNNTFCTITEGKGANGVSHIEYEIFFDAGTYYFQLYSFLDGVQSDDAIKYASVKLESRF